jgi:predicted RND superfamily exporter protein
VPSFGRFGSVIQRLRWPIVIAALCVVAATPFGIRRIEVQDSWIDGFAPESAFAENMDYFNDRYLGAHLLQIVVDTHAKKVTGILPAERIDMLEFSFPPDLVDDISWLPDSTIRMTYHGQRPEDFVGPVSEEWVGRIAEASRTDDRIRVKVTIKGSIAQMVLRLGPGDAVDYEIHSERLKHLDVLRRLAEFETFLQSRKDDRVGGVIGLTRLLSTANFMASSLKTGTKRLPDEVERAEWLWDQYRRIRGEARFRQTVSGDYARGTITVYLKEANFVDTARLLDAIRAYEREHLAPADLSVETAGDVAVSQAMIAAIVRTQVRSLLLSLVGIFVVAIILTRSVAHGLLCVVPCVVAVAISFAVMGWASIPLGVATSMFAGMTLGVGVDYGIHLIDRYRRLVSLSMDRADAISQALDDVGPAITIDALAVTIGFGVLILSQVPANQRLGALIAVSIAACLGVCLLLLPTLLQMIPRLPTKNTPT